MLSTSSSAIDPSWSPKVRRALLHNGYFPVPTNGKAPVLDNWPNIRATESDVEAWEKIPNAKNTGVLTATTPTIDIDVLDREMATKIHSTLVAPLIPQGYPKLVPHWPRSKALCALPQRAAIPENRYAAIRQ